VRTILDLLRGETADGENPLYMEECVRRLLERKGLLLGCGEKEGEDPAVESKISLG